MADISSSEIANRSERLNLETAKISWHELQRLFASGVLIVVQQGTDLIDTAERFIANDSEFVERLLSSSVIRKAEMSDAEKWNDENAVVWAVVVAPWVLVQEL